MVVSARVLTRIQQHERAASRVGVEGMRRKERQRELLSLVYQKTSDNGHLPMLKAYHYLTYIRVLPARI